jgi:hypothetical protein
LDLAEETDEDKKASPISGGVSLHRNLSAVNREVPKLSGWSPGTPFTLPRSGEKSGNLLNRALRR